MDTHTSVKPHQTSPRIAWIDVMRFMCAFLIVVGHTSYLGIPFALPRGLVCVMVWDTALVSAFFCISGFFSRPSSGYLNWKRFFHLLVPLVFWAVAVAFVTEKKHLTQLSWWGDVFGWGLPPIPINGPLWFMYYLLLLSLISPLLHRLPDKWLLMGLLLCVVLGEFYAHPFRNCSFFVGGMVLARVGLKRIQHFMENHYLHLILVAVVIPVSLMLLLGVEDNFFVDKTIAKWCGIAFLAAYAIFLEKKFPRVAQTIAAWGQYAFVIYAAHWAFLIWCSRFPHLIPTWVGTVLPIVVTFLLLGGSYLSMRILPSVASWITMVKPPRKGAKG